MLAQIFGSSCILDVEIDPGSQSRKKAFLKADKKGERSWIFSDGEDVTGTLSINVKPGKRFNHNGIKVEFIGQLDVLADRSKSVDFFVISKDLESAGVLFEPRSFKWAFNGVDKVYETYWGTNVRIRYFVRLSVLRNYASSITKETDIIVQNPEKPPDINTGIKMEVGIENCMHIEFEYDKSKYHLKDALIGKVYFLLVRIKIKHMQLDVVRDEIVGGGSSAIVSSESITKFEIMDGAPVRSECIPVRLYLGGLDITPTYKDVLNKMTVKYMVNLILVDEEDRRYFKKQEIVLWRKKIG